MRLNFKRRQRHALRRAVKLGSGVDALLITHLPDVRYLCGFTGSNGVLVVTPEGATLYTDGRYTTQAKAEVVGTGVVIVSKSAVPSAVEAMAAAGVKRCGFDAAQTSVAGLESMQEAFGSAQKSLRSAQKSLRSTQKSLRFGQKALTSKSGKKFFEPVGSVVAQLREVKDEDEIEVMRRAAHLGCRLFETMLGVLRPGMTELAAAAELEYAARLAGAERMSFDTIVASGTRSALPHGRASGERLPRKGFVTLDFGVVLEGYCSDMTRTVHLGRGSREELAVYDAVLEAQESAVLAIRPGVSVGDVDEAARSVLRRAGLDQYFSHSTGHGVGLEIHEGPRLAAKQVQRLERGMVVTVEPGVYMPGKFGVRIEDMVLVTATGGEVLTPSVKAWTEL